MAVRVLRVLEYVYPDAEAMVADRAMWQVGDLRRIGKDRFIRSTVMVPEIVADEEETSSDSDD